MPIFKQQQCKEPEVLQEVKSQELKVENLINKYRIMIILLFLISDGIAMHFLHKIEDRHMFYGGPGILILGYVLFRINKITKTTKPKPHVKYITIIMDYAFVLFGFLQAHSIISATTGVTTNQLLLIATILFILINSTSALRIQFTVIKMSTGVGLLCNAALYLLLGDSVGIMLYTSLFIILSGLFNLYVSNYIFSSFVSNHNLKAANDSLEEANNEINTQNEEIKTQNDELETQNEYLAQQRDQITHQKEQITASIEYAKRIQTAMLPVESEINRVTPNSFVLLKPKDIVSGDFYWFKKIVINEKEYSIYAAVDCTGHGVPGGFMSMMGFSFLNEIASQLQAGFTASDILNQLRELIKENLHQLSKNQAVKDGMDMALCVIDYSENKVQFAGANNPLYIIREENTGESNIIEEVTPDKMPVGVHIKEKASFTNHVIDVKPGDLLYTFSDGYIDQFGGSTNEKFKKRRFRALLEEISDQSLNQQKQTLSDRFIEWKGDHEQLDDVCVLGVMI